MQWIVEDSLSNFPFWSGGKDTADDLTDEQIERIEEYIDDPCSEKIWTDSEINNYFWFERDEIARLLGYKNYDNLMNDISDEELKDADDWAEDMINYPLSEHLTFMAEISGLTDEDIEDYCEDDGCETDEERADSTQDCITDEFSDYWESLSDKEKVELYRENGD